MSAETRYRVAFWLSLAAAAAAGLLALYGRWPAAAAAALVVLWAGGVLHRPFGESAYLTRVNRAIRDANVGFDQAHAIGEGPRAERYVVATADREARRLRRMRPPAFLAAEHAELVRLVEQQAAAVRRKDREGLAELNERLKAQLHAVWKRAETEA